jgi:putative Mg2+ transporter-C (MgtC) family protein
MVSPSEFALRVIVGGLLGTAIGFERQWRQRGAGMHTSALVAIGAALFALLAPVVGSDSETRILANIVTGVGFLAGGVILRQGASVSGLNTAATIWSTAAVGALAGIGQFAHAAMGAAAIAAFNLALQPLVEMIESRAIVRSEKHGAKAYLLDAVCDKSSVADVRAAIVDGVSTTKLNLHSISAESTEKGQELRAELGLFHRDDAVVERLAAILAQRPGVRRVTWQLFDET